MIVEVLGKYRLQPTSGGLDWSLFEYKTINEPNDKKRIKPGVVYPYDDWAFTGYYVSDIPHGLEFIYELELKRRNGKVDLKNLAKTCRGIRDEICKVYKVSEVDA